MANIDINLSGIIEDNARVMGLSASLDGIIRELELLRWRLEPEIMEQDEFSREYQRILARLRAQREYLQNVSRSIDFSVRCYEDAERNNIIKSQFL